MILLALLPTYEPVPTTTSALDPGQRLQPLDETTRELQALVRLREDHVKAKVAASNQLGALLDGHWPGAKQVFSRLRDRPGLPGRLPDPTGSRPAG
jgi:hypothetical protein